MHQCRGTGISVRHRTHIGIRWLARKTRRL